MYCTLPGDVKMIRLKQPKRQSSCRIPCTSHASYSLRPSHSLHRPSHSLHCPSHSLHRHSLRRLCHSLRRPSHTVFVVPVTVFVVPVRVFVISVISAVTWWLISTTACISNTVLAGLLRNFWRSIPRVVHANSRVPKIILSKTSTISSQCFCPYWETASPLQWLLQTYKAVHC